MRVHYQRLHMQWRQSRAFFHTHLISPVMAWWLSLLSLLQKWDFPLKGRRVLSYLRHLFSWQTIKRNPARVLSVVSACTLLCVCFYSAYRQFLPAKAQSIAQHRQYQAIARTTSTPYSTATTYPSQYGATPTMTTSGGVTPGYTPANTNPGYTAPGYTGPGTAPTETLYPGSTPGSHLPASSYTPPAVHTATPIAKATATSPQPTPAGGGNGGGTGGDTPTPVPTTPQPVASCTITPANPAVASTETATAVPTDTETAVPTETATAPATPTGTTVTATATPTTVPALSQLNLVTGDAYATEANQNVPNSWGAQKSRFIRTSTGELFTVYTAAGSGSKDRQWRLMHRTSQGTWEQLQCGDAGTEPVNLVLGVHDSIHLFTWPGTQGVLHHLVSTDLGKTMKDEVLPGKWDVSQGYSSAGVNAEGDIVVLETGADKPGVFLWSYYAASTGKWSFHSVQLDYRYTYAFLFLGKQHDLTIVGMRDVLRSELGYPPSSGNFNYIFNQIDYFYIKDATNPTSVQQVKVASEEPRSNADEDITYLTDSYMDTQGRTHILYNDQYKGPYEAILENGQVVKNVPLTGVDSGRKMRMTQDTTGRFYIIATSSDGQTINIYRGTDSDTDGTYLAEVADFDISRYASCNDYDKCHEPTFTVPRSGNALSDVLDGVYGSNGQEVYFQIKLR